MLKPTYILVFVLFASFSAYAAKAASFVQLPSPGLSLVNKAKYIGPTQPDEKISFTVWLKFRNKAQMDQMAHDIYDPHSPQFRHFLTKNEYLSQFAPTQEAKQNVQQYFIAHGMNAKINYNIVEVTASAKQVSQLFAVKFNNYQYENKNVYASTTPPTLPAAIAQYVQSITGLTNIPRFKPGLLTSAMAQATPTATSLRGFDATTLQNAYQFASIAPINGQRIDGTGQTIIIIDGDSTNGPAQLMADANTYSQGMLPRLTQQNFKVLDQNLNPCSTQCTASAATGWEHEQALDLQAVHTLAPRANIVMVVAQMANESGTENALETLVNELITNNFTIAGFPNAYVLSNSWSEQEAANEPLEPTLQAAMLSGLSVDFSSGDCGDNTQSPAVDPHCHGTLSVDYPPSSTFVTAVGGSSVFVDNDWNYSFETGWGYTAPDTGQFNGGSSGGISLYYGPVSWQSGISNFVALGYGVINTFGDKRALPDVAMLADSHTGLNIVVNGVTIKDGGTSLACPLFSAVATLVNQARAITAGGQNPMGQFAPALYTYQTALANNNALHLIIPPHPIIPGEGFPTAPGAPLSAFTLEDKDGLVAFSWDSSLGIVEDQYWNDVVGLGTPNVPRFVAMLAGLQ